MLLRWLGSLALCVSLLLALHEPGAGFAQESDGSEAGFAVGLVRFIGPDAATLTRAAAASLGDSAVAVRLGANPNYATVAFDRGVDGFVVGKAKRRGSRHVLRLKAIDTRGMVRAVRELSAPNRRALRTRVAEAELRAWFEAALHLGDDSADNGTLNP